MARGRLAFERAGAATAVREAYAESPLKLLTPRGDWVYLSTLGGGLVDGDRLELSIEVGAEASARVTTQGPTRVFRSRTGCSAETRATVGEGASLVLAPAPAACFADARFEQLTEINLAAGASLTYWDVLSAGRERWGFARYRSALSVRREGRALIDEALLLDAAHGSLADRLGRFDAIAALVVVGPGPAFAEEPLRANAEVLEAASRLAPDVTVVRLAASSVEAMLNALRRKLALPWRSDASFAA